MPTDMQRHMAGEIREMDLLKVDIRHLRLWCHAFNLSQAGERAEIVERLHREIWRKAYD